ncbi:MAG: hypothetical protein ACOC3T_05735 [Bacteroidota bacterium]
MFEDYQAPLDLKIKQAEDKWLPSSYNYLRSLFKGQKLVSHDQDHHFRTWVITKILLQQKNREGVLFSAAFIEALLIAVMFHDAGMSRTINKTHGEESRKICEDFLSAGPGILDGYFKALLNAIVHHDDKMYKKQPDSPNMTEEKWLLRLLCMADDLEAFGALGVFRYTEIYLLRGIAIAQLPQQVIDNVVSRFDHFCSFFPDSTGVQLFYQRYYFIYDFFSMLLNDGVDNDNSQSSIIKMIESHLTGRYHDIHSVYSFRHHHMLPEEVFFLKNIEAECLELNRYHHHSSYAG